MPLLDRLFGKRRASPPAERPASPATPAAMPARAPGGVAARPAIESLPGSEPAVLAAAGQAGRAALGADARARKLPATGLEIYVVEHFLTPEECREIIALIDADIKPSEIHATSVGADYRTSETCLLPSSEVLVADVELRIAQLLALPADHSQPIQGQRYRQGQQFKVHNDYFAGGQPYSDEVAQEGGQRTWTAMVYLNAPEAGGATDFPRAGIRVSPRAGALLVWNNLDAEGRPNRFSHHAGMVVESGTKYVLTKWFRERRYVPVASA